jgi:Carboxypeptidase regulatory-like domain
MNILVSMVAAIACGQIVTTGVKGTVVDATDAPVSGTEAVLKLDQEHSSEYRATANEKGIFQFVSIPEGTYDLTLRHAGFLAKITRSIDVDAGKITELGSLTLQIGGCGGRDLYEVRHVPLSKGVAGKGSLSAIVRYEPRKPLGGIFVYLLRMESILERTTTDANGKFSFRDLEPGDYSLLIDAKGFYAAIMGGYEVQADLESRYESVWLARCQKGDCDPKHREFQICE